MQEESTPLDIEYRVEDFSSILNELQPLFDIHYKEIASDQEHIKLNMNYQAYSDLCESGSLMVCTARANGKLVGYFFVFVTPHIRYQDHKMAESDILYVHPAYRRHSIFSNLLKFVEQRLEERGASKLYISMKVWHDFSSLLERMGYRLCEFKFEKLLNEGG